nr:MAG TPA: hypothetical protein [Caudoviricetes sp.]
MKAYKGFDKDLKCKGFQYEVGKEYETSKVILCYNGFHACTVPLDVFNYYAPATSRFCEVEIDGEIEKAVDDSKIAGTKIKIIREISLSELIDAQKEYEKGKEGRKVVTGGSCGMATARDYGAATVGDCGTAVSRGISSTGKDGLCVARGNGCRVKGGIGSVLVIAKDTTNSMKIVRCKTAVVDGKKIKADTWYTLQDGEFSEVVG